MKVLWFTPTTCGAAFRNGENPTLGSWIFSLEKELKKMKEIELSVAYISQSETASFVYDGVSYYPIKKTKWDNLMMRVRGRHSNKIIPECLTIIERVRPDIIHIHGTEHAFPLMVGHTNVPTVISMQGILTAYADKYYSGIPRDVVIRHERLKSKILFLGSWAMYRLTKNSANSEVSAFSKLKYIIGRTDWDFSISRFFAPNSKYFHCDEMLRDIFYTVKWKQVNNTEPKIVTTISNNFTKGLEVVYRTAHMLKKHNVKFEWIIIGTEPDSEYDKVVRIFCGITSQNVNVNLVGRKNAEEMLEIMLSSDIYVQVSHIENSPNSLCEAMMLGMPIIASNVGGTNSLITDGVDGYLVQDGDSCILASRIVHMQENYRHAVIMGEHARERALKRHNHETIIKQVLNCYNIMKNNDEAKY